MDPIVAQSQGTTVVVRRVQGPLSRLVPYAILLDGKRVGAISENGEARFVATPGVHNIQFKNAWIRSRALEFTMTTDSTVIVTCRGARNPAWHCFVAWRNGIDLSIGKLEPVSITRELVMRVALSMLAIPFVVAIALWSGTLAVTIGLGMTWVIVLNVVPLPQQWS